MHTGVQRSIKRFVFFRFTQLALLRLKNVLGPVLTSRKNRENKNLTLILFQFDILILNFWNLDF